MAAGDTSPKPGASPGAGAKGKEKEESLAAECSVCGDPAASHLHYGAVSCYSCRAFFRRGQPKQIRCIFGHGQCKITRHNRTNCKLCRYRRCIEVGMKPEKVDFYLNKRKEREAESQKPSEDGAEAAEAEQAPNRSPASEEKTRRRGRRSRDSRDARPRRESETLSLSPNQPQLSSADRSPVDPGGHGGPPHQSLVTSHSPGGLMASHSPHHQPQPPRYSPHGDLPSPFSSHQGLLAPDLARFMNLPLPGSHAPRFPPEMSSYQRFSPMPGYPQEAGERLRHPLYRDHDPALARGHMDQALVRGQYHPQLGPGQWGWPRDQRSRDIITGGHVTRDMGHVRPPASRYHQQPPRGQQTSVIRNRFVNSDPGHVTSDTGHVTSDTGHVTNRDTRHVYDVENYGSGIKQEAASSSCSSDDDQQHIPQTVTNSSLSLVHAERNSTKVLFSTNEIPQNPSDKYFYLGVGHRARDEDLKSVASQERPSALFQPYTSVIKRNTDILASAQKSSSPHHHQTVNFSRDHVPRPENWQQAEVEALQEIKTEDLESLESELIDAVMPKMELPCSPEAVHEDFKIMIPKRNTDPDTESGDSQDEIDEILSQVPLKKRARMMEVPYSTLHAIDKKVNLVMSFTFEEEFKVMDYIVRIEQYQNRRFEYVLANFPQYNLVLMEMVRRTAEEQKIPFNAQIDKMLFNIGLEFTKQNCVDIYEEMGALNTSVQREMLNCTYPALYVVMFAIMEGNTRERTWVDQQMKTVHITKENHRSLEAITKHLSHVRPVSIKDMEKFTSPWAVAAEDEEKFARTVSSVGRLLRDDLHLQALYHMLVMLSPGSRNSPEVKNDPVLKTVRRSVAELLYRYLSTKPNMQYSKTTGSGQQGCESSIMKISAGVEDLSAADKTLLLMELVEHIHDCVDIMENRSLKVFSQPPA